MFIPKGILQKREFENKRTELEDGQTEGSSLTIEDSAEENVEIFLEGNTYQEDGAIPEDEKNIKVVTGENNIKVQNKNLFNNTNYEKGYSYIGTTKSANANWGIYYLACNNNEIITISGLKGYGNVSIVQTDINKNAISELQRRMDNVSQYTITATSDGYIAITFLWTNVGRGSELDTIQIEIGSTATSYVPHQEQNYPINLGNNYLASNPTGTIRDEIVGTPNNWRINRKIGKIDLSTIDNFSHNQTWNNPNAFAAGNVINHGIDGYTTKADLYSNRFLAETPANITYNKNDKIGLGASTTIFVSITGITTKADLDNYFSNNTTYLYYSLETPVEEPITDTTLIKQLNKLYERAKTYHETTYITAIATGTNLPFNIKIKYKKSNLLRIQALEQAILSQGANV